MTEEKCDYLNQFNIPSKATGEKIFVLDTNVAINDPECFRNFGDNIVIIPYHTMITELNNVHKKTKNPMTSHNCMEALRHLKLIKKNAEKEIGNNDFKIAGYQANKEGGKIFFIDETKLGKPEDLEYSADLGIGDERYLECTRQIKMRYEPLGYKVVLVTNDFALSIHAEYNNISAEAIKRGTVEINDLLSGYGFCVNQNILSDLYSNTEKDIPLDKYASAKMISKKYLGDLLNNNYVIFVSSEDEIHKIDSKNSYSILAKYSNSVFRIDKGENALRRLYYHNPHLTISGIRPKNLEQWLFLNNCLEPTISLSVGYGPEGTGKTFLELAASLNIARRHVSELSSEEAKVKGPLIHLTKPMKSREEYGYLPGDLEAKLDPAYSSYMRNLRKLCTYIDKSPSSIKIKGSFNKNVHEFGYEGKTPPSIDEVYRSFEGLFKGTENNAPLAEFLPLGMYRGINISPNEILVIDEMQNTEPADARTLLSRSEEGSKTYVTGCPWQVDDRFLRANYNGLLTLIYAIQNTNLKEHPEWNFSAVIKLMHQERGRQAEWASEMLNNI